MTDLLRITYWCPVTSSADAVEDAKREARKKGYTVATVARVAYVERPTGWAVTLAVRS